MRGSIQKRKSNKASLFSFLLLFYIASISCLYYYISITYTPFTSMFFDTSDMDRFTNLFEVSGFFANFSFKNIIYSLYFVISKDIFFSYTWTSFTMFVVCIYLLYIIVISITKIPKYYGFLSVLIFTTFPHIMLNVFAVNVHISETMLVLMVVYFYFKSTFSLARIYFFAYLFFSLISIFIYPSTVMYIVIIILWTSYTQLRERNYIYIICNFIILFSFIFTGIFISNSGYFYSKLGHWHLYFLYMNIIDMCKIGMLMVFQLIDVLKSNLSWVSILLFFLCFPKRITDSSKNKIKLLLFVEKFILLVLLFYLLTIVPSDTSFFNGIVYGDTPLFYDIFPIYAFISMLLVLYIHNYLRPKKYLLGFIFTLVVVAGINSFYFSYTNFLEKENAILRNTQDNYSQGSWSAIYADVNKTISETGYDKFLLVVDKEDTNRYYFIKKEASRIVFVPTQNMIYGVNNKMNYIFDYLYDIMLLNGCNNFEIATEEDRLLLADYEFEGHTLCFVSRDENFKFTKACKIEEVNSWTLLLEGEKHQISMFAVVSA